MIRFASMKDIRQIAELYCICFAEALWFETYEVEDVAGEMEGWLRESRATLLVDEVDGRIRGVGLGFPTSLKSDVLEVIGQSFADTYYVSELFVAPEFRRQCIIREITRELFRIVQTGGVFTRAVARTSRQQLAIIHLTD